MQRARVGLALPVIGSFLRGVSALSSTVSPPSTSGRVWHNLPGVGVEASRVSIDATRRPKALFLDAAGTFLIPSEAVPTVYLRYAKQHDVSSSPGLVLGRFRDAYNAPWDGPIRYAGDARDFWRRVVFTSLGTTKEAVFDAIYEYYKHPSAWTVDPGLAAALMRIRRAGVKTCVVSNFDNRLRPLLEEMGIADLFDHVIVSAEVGAEKPNPVIFEAACRACGLSPKRDHIIHVGDDRRNDIWGARDSGLTAWMWGVDISSFEELADRIEAGNIRL